MTVIGTNTRSHELAAPGDTKTAFVLGWGVATDVGHKRAHNEDSLIAVPTVFAVADGMGGHAAGDLASKAVVTRLAEKADEGVLSAELVTEALRQATDDISLAIDEQNLGVGTTVTGIAMALHENQPHWVVFNVGDSRVYLLENDALSQITVDHSVVHELLTAGLISADDAENHPDSNVVTRAVGFNAAPVPDFWLIPVTAGTRILVCSDGLTREVSDRKLQGHLTAGFNAEETVNALIDNALAEGGHDNVTAIVVDVSSGGDGLTCEDGHI